MSDDDVSSIMKKLDAPLFSKTETIVDLPGDYEVSRRKVGVGEVAVDAQHHSVQDATPKGGIDAVITPTSQRAAQSDFTIVRDGASRVRSSVRVLLDAGKITRAESRAAERWYRDHALAVHRARDTSRSGGNGESGSFEDALVSASMNYRAAEAAIGSRAQYMLVLSVAHGFSFRQIGAEIGRESREIAGAVEAALCRLAEHYARVDGACVGPESRIRAGFAEGV